TLAHFNGLTQIYPTSFSRLDSLKTLEPLFLTIAEIKAQNWNAYEAYEGMLVRVNNVTVSGSGNWVGNINYVINDGTGTTLLRITRGTTLVGQPIPTGTFDVIAALGAYKTSAPYDASSYQLLPRTISDIITDNKPLIILPVIASNITSTSFKVFYETLRDGDTEVRYGLTPSLELGMLKDAALTKNHSVTISGLTSLTKYYFKVYSTNTAGTSEGPLETVTTASTNPSTGMINVYFNSTENKCSFIFNRYGALQFL
ncbi:MAG: hypothetical protein KJ666_12740, partial [Bacteroidetes bacterium]|nr:hypothetical protein [Bacteroidota bacterium]